MLINNILGNTKSLELELLNEELKQKNEQIEACNKLMIESLMYAGKLQRAIIPPKAYFEKVFPYHFVFYKPKDFVSGDFFWILEKNEVVYFAVADCTGHGVPGALMSILGMSILNEIANLFLNWNSISASDVLNLMRNQLTQALHQNENCTKINDEMDIGFCIFNKETLELQYSGAFMPLYIVRRKELIEIKGNSMPVGNYVIEKPFYQTEIQLETNDMIYLATDGYRDQFGGANYKKFLAHNFRELLVHIANKELLEQKRILKETFFEWKKGNDQTDDITVIGIRIGQKPHIHFSI